MSYNFATRIVEMVKPGTPMGFALVHNGNETKICEVHPGGHAEKAGFKLDDRFVSINGIDTFNLNDNDLGGVIMSVEVGDTLKCVVTDATKVQEASLKVLTGNEATVGHLLTDAVHETYKDKTVSEIFKTVPVNDPLHTGVKLAVYDMTVPLTTRPMRQGEVDGEHYHFVTVEEFKRYIAEDKMLEYGTKNNVYYGTLKLDSQHVKPVEERPSRRKETPQSENTQAIPPQYTDTEAHVGAVLGADAHASHRHKSISQFFTDVPAEHPEHGAARNKVREIVYDMTIPYTTRVRREGEKDGRDYHFVDAATFKKLHSQGNFLEIGEKSGVYYGTPKLMMSDVDKKYSRRTTLTEAINQAPKEPSISEILTHTDSLDPKIVGLENQSASQFLAQIDPKDPKFADVRKNIKDVIYDLTVPLTTRPPRKGETNGVEYNFVSREQFEHYIHSDQMLEYGEKNGVYYGTMKLTKEKFDHHKEVKRRTTMAEALQQPGAITTSAPFVTLGDEETWESTLV